MKNKRPARAGRSYLEPERPRESKLDRRANQLDPAVDFRVRIPRILQPVLADADGLQRLAVDRMRADQMLDDCACTLFRKLLVQLRRAACVGVAFDHDLAGLQLALPRFERLAQADELRLGFRRELGRAGAEPQLHADRTLSARTDRQALVLRVLAFGFRKQESF